jgi:hypothetical protein
MMKPFLTLLDVQMSENDKRMLIIFMIVLILFLIILGLIGMAIRKTMSFQARRIDKEMSDPVRYHVVTDQKHFRDLALKKSNRVYYRQALVPFLAFAMSALFYVFYNWGAQEWGADLFGRYSTLFFIWDFGNSDNYTTFFGMTILNKWPALLQSPCLVPEYWASYIIVTLWIFSLGWYLIASQAYIARFFMIFKREATVYDKSLEGYNYYNSTGMGNNPYGTPVNGTPPNGNVPPRR